MRELDEVNEPSPDQIEEVRQRIASGEPLWRIEEDLDLRENQQRTSQEQSSIRGPLLI